MVKFKEDKTMKAKVYLSKKGQKWQPILVITYYKCKFSTKDNI